MDLNTLSPHEIDALETAIRKLRQQEEQKRIETARRSGPRSWKCSIQLRTRRNGQSNIPIICDGLSDAFEQARQIAAENGRQNSFDRWGQRPRAGGSELQGCRVYY